MNMTGVPPAPVTPFAAAGEVDARVPLLAILASGRGGHCIEKVPSGCALAGLPVGSPRGPLQPHLPMAH